MRSPVMRRRSSMSDTRSFFMESQRKKLTPFFAVINAPLSWLLVPCVAAVDHSTADDRGFDFRTPDSLGTNVGQVAIDDHHIGEFPRCQRSLLVLLEGGVCCTSRICTQRVFDGDFLFRHPAAGMLVV